MNQDSCSALTFWNFSIDHETYGLIGPSLKKADYMTSLILEASQRQELLVLPLLQLFCTIFKQEGRDRHSTDLTLCSEEGSYIWGRWLENWFKDGQKKQPACRPFAEGKNVKGRERNKNQ